MGRGQESKKAVVKVGFFLGAAPIFQVLKETRGFYNHLCKACDTGSVADYTATSTDHVKSSWLRYLM